MVTLKFPGNVYNFADYENKFPQALNKEIISILTAATTDNAQRINETELITRLDDLYRKALLMEQRQMKSAAKPDKHRLWRSVMKIPADKVTRRQLMNKIK